MEVSQDLSPAGEPKKLTIDPDGFRFISALTWAADGRSLVYSGGLPIQSFGGFQFQSDQPRANGSAFALRVGSQ